jgi:hypothetical protein
MVDGTKKIPRGLGAMARAGRISITCCYG